jgi:hypothetical protein
VHTVALGLEASDHPIDLTLVEGSVLVDVHGRGSVDSKLVPARGGDPPGLRNGVLAGGIRERCLRG